MGNKGKLEWERQHVKSLKKKKRIVAHTVDVFPVILSYACK